MGMTFDGPNKLIILTNGTSSVSVRDLWSRWIDWYLTDDNSKYLPTFETVGGNDIDESEGTKIPVYAFLLNGWKIRPQEANHTLKVSDGILLVSGGGDPFVNTLGNYVVRINYQQPVQAISFVTGSSGTGEADWTTTERKQIRKKLGIDGDSEISSAVPELATAANQEEILTNINTVSKKVGDTQALVFAAK